VGLFQANALQVICESATQLRVVIVAVLFNSLHFSYR